MEESSIQAAAPHDVENPYVQLETSMTEELDRLSPMSPSRCIFRVPHRLRCLSEKAYTPQVISIGPLHHGNSALKVMEEHKMRSLQYFLGRTNSLSLKDYIRKIKDQEAKLRSCYSETIQLESDEFVRMILVDVIFIIEFLFGFSSPRVRDENDCIFGEPLMQYDIVLDLVMLENQLPFFILKDIFYGLNDADDRCLLVLSRNFLASVSSAFEGIVWNNLETIKSSEVKHFVDLLRKLCIDPILKEKSEEQSKPTMVRLTPTSILNIQSMCLLFPLCPKKEEEQYKHTTTLSITKLHLAGVKFKVRSTMNLFEIKFVNGILEIPELKTDDFTELTLRNLVAFEQCSVLDKYYISDYFSIMDMFLDTPKDVELLVKYRIVENALGGGDDELSTMINRLSTGILCDADKFYYGTLCQDLNKFCSSKWHKSIANLKQNYFNTPWKTISFFAAVLLLILTMVQTIFSIISLP
ncbi:hypothetical protein M0R45_007366 [Rubus argutus]|uniref:Uncharacterized protein n=1 Tax=Rubus argutus TaxID=59490 RepID=A0AAW1XY19_RUBAR